MTTGHETRTVDVRERGNDKNGQPIALDRRLFMQVLGFTCSVEQRLDSAAVALSDALNASGLPGVVYEDLNHPRGFAMVTLTEDPADFVEKLRPRLAESTCSGLEPRPELSMLGRTYSTGFEQDLEYWLLRRPRETVLNNAWPWAIWYPLRRKGGFERLDPKEKGGVMREHGGVGRAYGESDLAHDVRLACHGLDQSDNDFVIGLVGANLHHLSHVVQAMRATRQTAEFMEKLGPFFVGHALFRSAGKQ
jgi:chlorite dismutase